MIVSKNPEINIFMIEAGQDPALDPAQAQLMAVGPRELAVSYHNTPLEVGRLENQIQIFQPPSQSKPWLTCEQGNYIVTGMRAVVESINTGLNTLAQWSGQLNGNLQNMTQECQKSFERCSFVFNAAHENAVHMRQMIDHHGTNLSKLQHDV